MLLFLGRTIYLSELTIMKKILPIFIAFIMTISAVSADNTELEEVILESLGEGADAEEVVADDIKTETPPEIIKEKTLAEKLSDVYHLEIEQIKRPSYLFENILTKDYGDDSLIKSTHIWGAYRGYWDYSITEDNQKSSTYGFNAVNLGIDGNLKNNVADFRIMMGIIPQSHRNMTKNMFSDVYIATNKIPHHRIMVGHIRPKVGMEGGNSAYTLPFINPRFP